MGVIKKTNNAGWPAGKEISFYFVSDGATPDPAGQFTEKNNRLEQMLEVLSQVTHYASTAVKPGKNNDSADTAGLKRPFRVGALWVNSAKQMWVCTSATPGAAVWLGLTGAGEESSSSSSSESSSSESSSSSSSESSSSSDSSSSSSSSTEEMTTSSSSDSSSSSSSSPGA